MKKVIEKDQNNFWMIKMSEKRIIELEKKIEKLEEKIKILKNKRINNYELSIEELADAFNQELEDAPNNEDYF